jgi:hypothetical protein
MKTDEAQYRSMLAHMTRATDGRDMLTVMAEALDHPEWTTTERMSFLVERLADITERWHRDRGTTLDEEERAKLREAILGWLVDAVHENAIRGGSPSKR